MDGESSSTVHVDSGVPQGTVLGPLMFLLYINDIGNNLNSQIKLFADDCLLYRTIQSADDTTILQNDLEKLKTWTEEWQMNFNSEKCFTLRIHKNKNPIIKNYTLGRDILGAVPEKTYLGVEIDEQLNWKAHITAMTAKAGRTLGFLRRNLGTCPPSIKQQAYTSLVRSKLEYASVVWDPYKKYQIDQIEQIQRRAVRFICGNYQQDASVTKMREDLRLPLLEDRRRQARLLMFYKAINDQIAIPIPQHLQPRLRVTRQQQQHRYVRIRANTDIYNHSFFPRTLRDWDMLPQDTIELSTVEQFKGAICAQGL